MSKVFSISLATVLMLINIVGPMQPASVMEDPPQETAPIVDETLIDDSSGSDEADIEASESVEPPPAENDEIVADEENVSPVEEPAEQSNSPPAEAPIIHEDDGEDSNPDLISPSAIDPDPGNCGRVDQPPCPGGTDPVAVSIQIWVSDITTSSFISTATVVVKNDQETVIGTFSTADGVIYLDLVPGSRYTADVTAPGYNAVTGSVIEPTASNYFFPIRLYAPPQVVKSSVTFEVVNARTQQPLPAAEISIVFDRTWSHADSGSTESDGTWTSKQLTEGKYWASVTAGEDFHERYDIEVNIPASNTIRVELQPISRSPISFKFVDAATNAPVEDAFFILYRAGWGSDVEDSTPASGEYVTGPLEHGTYVIEVRAAGYGYVFDYRWEHPHEGALVIQLQPISEGTVTIHAVDRYTGDPLPHAMVSVFDENFTTVVASGQTDTDGKWTSPVLPGGHYRASVYPVYHFSEYPYISIVSGNSNFTVMFEEFHDIGYLYVNVSDITWGQTLQNATITVKERDYGVIASGSTDADGFWSMPYLPAGHYEVTIQRAGYTSQTISLSKTHRDAILDIELHRPGQFKFRFWLLLPRCSCNYNSGTLVPVGLGLGTSNGLMVPMALQTVEEFDPIVGATARLVDPITMDVVAETTSDEDGLVDFGEVPEGEYILQISGGIFSDYTQPISLTGDLELNFVFEPADEDTPTNPGDDDEDTDPGTPTNPGDDDEDNDPGTPTNPGDDDEDNDPGTPTNPGDDDEDNDPGSGTPGDGEPGDGEPGDGEPGDGEPGDGEPGDGEPGDGEPGDGTTPGTEVPDNGTAPVPGDDESEQPVDTDGDNNAVDSNESVDADAIAQSAGASTDASSGDVNQLPNTGAGESKPNVIYAAITLVAAFFLLGALGVRRSTR